MKQNLMMIAIAAAIAVGAAGVTAFVVTRGGNPAGTVAAKPPRLPIDAQARYVSLDKLIVMLRSTEGSARPRYVVMDLVFSATDAKREKQVKEPLPVLRATAYSVLAERTAAEIQRMGPVDLAAMLNKEYEHGYGGADRTPFDKVLVTKVMMD